MGGEGGLATCGFCSERGGVAARFQLLHILFGRVAHGRIFSGRSHVRRQERIDSWLFENNRRSFLRKSPRIPGLHFPQTHPSRANPRILRSTHQHPTWVSCALHLFPALTGVFAWFGLIWRLSRSVRTWILCWTWYRSVHAPLYPILTGLDGLHA